jgi:hypothetical protein
MKTNTLAVIFALIDDPKTTSSKRRKLKEAARAISLGFPTSHEAIRFHDSIAHLLK